MMLGSQLVTKSIKSPAAPTTTTTTTATANNNNNNNIEATTEASNIKKQQDEAAKSKTTTNSKTNNVTTPTKAAKSTTSAATTTKSTPQTKSSIPTSPRSPTAADAKKQSNSSTVNHHVAQVQQLDHRPHETSNVVGQNSNGASGKSGQQQVSSKELEQLGKEAQELKIKTRRLQLEIDEKNEIISVLKDELETTKESSDKIQRENLQILKDAKRVKFLQDEIDFLQDKIANCEKLEAEVKKLKEKLQEHDFLKLRIKELEEDRAKAQEESADFEKRWQAAEQKLVRVGELETELNKWKSFSHELETERNSIQNKLVESIEQESKLNLINKQVEDEICRLRSIIKSYEEQRDEEQASNSFIMSVADLKQLDHDAGQHNSKQHQSDSSNLEEESNTAADTSIQYELEKQMRKELEDENKALKEKLERRDSHFSEIVSKNDQMLKELECNKKLISELRQDLACEKNLALKLAKLANSTRQSKSLEQQKLPNGKEVSSSVADKEPQSKNSSPASETSSVTSIIENSTTAAQDHRAPTSSSLPMNDLANGITALNNDATQQVELLPSAASANEKSAATKVAFSSSGSKTNEAVNRSSSTKELAKNFIAKIEVLQQTVVGKDNERGNSKEASPIGAIENVAGNANKLIARKSVDAANLVKVNGSSEDKKDATTTTHEALKLLATRQQQTHRTTTTATSSLETNDDQSKVFRRPSPTAAPSGELDGEWRKQTVHANHNGGNKTSNNLGISIDITHNSNNTTTSNTSNNNSNKPTANITSVSPSSLNARSQSSSPSSSVAISCAGHDSGFQSINHDFNQISPRNNNKDSDASSSRKESNSQIASSSLLLPLNFADAQTGGELAPSPRRQATNRSTPITGQQPTGASTSTSNSAPVTATATARDAAEKRQSPAPSASSSSSSSSTTTSTTPTKIRDKVVTGSVTTAATDSTAKTADGSQSSSAKTNPLLSSACSRSTTATSETNNTFNRSESATPMKVSSVGINGKTTAKRNNYADDNFDELAGVEKTRRAPTPGKTTTSASGNFVRNSLPSRSVNFGHSRPTSAYLDRIRASVSATTTTNSVSSYQEQQTHNVLLTSQKQQQHQQQQHHARAQQVESGAEGAPRYWLNCMLDHQHTRKCFVDISSSASHRLPLMQSQVVANDYTSPHVNGLPPAASRQLNALIDPVSQEQLMVSMLQHQNQHQPPQGQPGQHPAAGAHRQPFPLVPEGTKLTEQQLAHLASLHHQHYYHHLQHMHQLHQLHHQHHLHLQRLHQQQHKCPQQPSQQQHPTATSSGANQPMDEQLAACQRHAGSQASFGGSQFQAPIDANQFEQLYANVTTNSPNGRVASQLRLSQPTRVSPSRGSQSFNHNPSLPQIDEINGLPNVNLIANQSRQVPSNGHSPHTSNSSSPTKQHRQQPPNGNSKDQQQQTRSTSSNGSPTSDATTTPSSPTSSGSSNLSPSSASSSSSLNSLSANVPMNRSAALRHTTTNISRRQFSVERELITNVPMTATLSRVGSCRTSRSTGDARLSTHEFNRRLATASGNDLGVMREPLASQQPSMRTSKILNISGQQQQQTSQAPSNIRVNNGTGGGAQERVDKLTCNLADIRLNDRLAFSSLRIPKGATGNMIGRPSQVSGAATATMTNGQPTGTSKEAPVGIEKRTKSNGSGNSAVWFEYGCV